MRQREREHYIQLLGAFGSEDCNELITGFGSLELHCMWCGRLVCDQSFSCSLLCSASSTS